MPGLRTHTHALAGVHSVLSPLSYISSCCFLRGHWFRHTRGCGIDPQSSALSSSCLQAHLFCCLRSYTVEAQSLWSDLWPLHQLSHSTNFDDSLIFSSAQPIFFSLSLYVSPLSSVSLSVQFWMILRKNVCMLILTWMMSTWCNDNLISDAQHKNLTMSLILTLLMTNMLT